MIVINTWHQTNFFLRRWLCILGQLSARLSFVIFSDETCFFFSYVIYASIATFLFKVYSQFWICESPHSEWHENPMWSTSLVYNFNWFTRMLSSTKSNWYSNLGHRKRSWGAPYSLLFRLSLHDRKTREKKEKKLAGYHHRPHYLYFYSNVRVTGIFLPENNETIQISNRIHVWNRIQSITR